MIEPQQAMAFEAEEKERKLTFRASVAGVIAGLTGGIIYGRRLLRESLHQWIDDMRHPDVMDQRTVSGYNALRESPHYVDMGVKVSQKTLKDHVDIVYGYLRRKTRLGDVSMKMIFEASNEAFVNDTPELLKATLTERGVAAGKIEQITEKLFKEEVGEKVWHMKNLRRIVDKGKGGIYDEMIKRSEMNLGLRHAHSQMGVVFKSVGATVAIGVVAYAATKWLMHVNDKRKAKAAESFKQQVSNSREDTSTLQMQP